MGMGMRHALRWALASGGAMLLCVVVACWHPLAANAATLTVNTINDTTDSGALSLRDAITAVNNGSAAGLPASEQAQVNQTQPFGTNDTIQFEVGGVGARVILLSDFLPALAKSVVIDGSTQPQWPTTFIAVDGQNTVGIFQVNNGVTVTLNGLTIQHGSGSVEDTCGFSPCGGGIVTQGTLTVRNSTVANNTASFNNGGGIYNNGGTLTVTNSTFASNSAGTGSGGGIYNDGGTVTVTNSTFASNSASGSGGGIEDNFSGSPTTNLTVTNSTFSGNSVGHFGGGIDLTNNAKATLTNTIVANSTSGKDCNADLGNGITADSHDLADDNTCGGATQVTSGQINLQPLGDNGGPTQTMALVSGSVAIDAGVAVGQGPSGNTVPNTDQRGAPRPINGTPDIGAFEFFSGYTTVVNNTGEGSANAFNCAVGNPNTCRLRDAVAVVNAGSAGTNPTISFADAVFPSNTLKTITLANGTGEGELELIQNVTILGTGHQVAVDGAHLITIFIFDPGTTAQVTGLIMQNGASVEGSGAIVNGGTLTVTNCTFTGNSGGFQGGAIENFGTLTVINSTFANNTARNGGAIYDAPSETTSLSLMVVGSTFTNNTAVTTSIPAKASTTRTRTTKVPNQPIRNDGLEQSGGAIFLCPCSNGAITNSTFTGNTAVTDGGAVATEGPLTLSNVTISGNSANKGGGVFVSTPDGGTLFAINTLIAGNTLSGSGGAGPDVNGPFTNASTANFIGDGTGMTGITNGANGNQVGTAASPLKPLLSALGNYGGPTQTMALLPGSPAIDTGTNTGCGEPLLVTKGGRLLPSPIDQRGVSRPQGAQCDIGAFETQGFTLTPSGTPQTTGLNTQFAQPLGVTVTPKNPGDPVAGGTIGFTVTPASGGASATLSAPNQTIDSNGKASVTATANGTVGSYTATASTAGASPATFNLTNAVITITPTTLPNGTAGTAYPGQTITATGGTGPYSFTLLSGSLPPGLTLKTDGTLSGTPTSGGAFTFTVQATDTNGLTGTQQYTINVATLVSLIVTYNGSTTPTVLVGQVAPFVATAVYSDNTQVVVTTQSTWSSDNTVYAIVEATTGKVTGEAPNGSIPLHITATMGGLTGQATVTVAPPTPHGIAPSPAPAGRPAGTTGVVGSPNPVPSPAPPSNTPSGGSTPGAAPTGR